MTELPPLYGYNIAIEIKHYFTLYPIITLYPSIAFGTCALEVMLNELEKGNVIVHITLRDHD